MTTHINVLIPVRLPDWWKNLAIERYAQHASVGTVVVGVDLSASQQRASTGATLPSFLLENARKQEAAGVSAHIIDCFGDPGEGLLSRELTSPVVGVGHAGLWYAYGRFSAFAVITSERDAAERIRTTAARWGFDRGLVDVLSIDTPAAEIPGDTEKAFAITKGLAETMADRADGLVLGCTELAEFALPLESALRGRWKRIRVVNPIAVAIRIAELRALMEQV
jgi:allantoin racemase